MTQLVPFHPRKVPTLWLDVTDLDVLDVLDRAHRADAERVMLTGPNRGPSWLLGDVGSLWAHGAHHLDHETPVGRYTLRGTQRRVEIRRAAEWFGAGDYTPEDAASAWDALAAILAAVVPGAGLLGSPGATGREAWLHSLPRDRETGRTVVPPQVDAEVAELLRATSGQHRIELIQQGGEHNGLTVDGVPSMPGLWVMDGRLMYAACVRELGTGPVKMLTGVDAAGLLTDPRGRYARARYRVRAIVPAWWEQVGILPLADDDGAWQYPSEPGREFTTWADAAEVHLALDHGWTIVPIEGLLFTKGRPLDTWADRLLRGYAKVNADELGTTVARMVRAGFRWMLLHSVGAWHSTGRTETTVTAGQMVAPAGDGWGLPTVTATGATWQRRVPLDGRAALMAHPEYSAQIWGRARARVLWAPTAVKGTNAGALAVPPHQLVSIYGDAVMTTERPEWGAPAYDDGKPGRLRVKGHLCGPIPWPTSARARDRLMHQAERATAAGQPCTCGE